MIAAFIAGGVAGAVSRTIVSPLERLKILFQIQSVGREEYKMSIWKALVKMGKEEGWRGFLRGNGTNCVRIIPYSAVQFGSYNFYKKVSLNRREEDVDAAYYSHLAFRRWINEVACLNTTCTNLYSLVRRAYSRERPDTRSPSIVRWSCWNYISHIYLST